jgi:SAM-dependent methyltransferase
MNAQELAANPRLDAWLVHDLNVAPRLPFADVEFDAAACCVSIDYLVRPVEVLRDLARVLGPGAPLVVTFSNRRFPTKVIALWESLDDAGRGQLVAHYLREAAAWTDIAALDRSPATGDPLLAVVARRAASVLR